MKVKTKSCTSTRIISPLKWKATSQLWTKARISGWTTRQMRLSSNLTTNNHKVIQKLSWTCWAAPTMTPTSSLSRSWKVLLMSEWVTAAGWGKEANPDEAWALMRKSKITQALRSLKVSFIKGPWPRTSTQGTEAKSKRKGFRKSEITRSSISKWISTLTATQL
jgi:hypothetical protein